VNRRVSLREHLAALREADQRFDAERDRRYHEVDIERERALKIKETADLAALELARTIQTYKDEKANELREQINSERNLYATKSDLEASAAKIMVTVQANSDYVSSAQGSKAGIQQFTTSTLAFVGVIAALAAALGHYVT
jgi:hypothetical protein